MLDWVGEWIADRLLAAGMSFSLREYGILALGGGLCMLAALGIAGLLGVPVEPAFNGSLLAGPSPVVAIVAGVVVIGVGLVIGLIIAASIGVEAAVFCSAVGLAAVAVRCGPIRPVLQYATGRSVFGLMTVEAVALGGTLLGGWLLLERAAMRARHRTGAATPQLAVPNEVTDATAAHKATAAGIAALVMAAIELILIQTDGPKQCIVSIAVAAFFGTLAGYHYLPIGQGVWFWLAPLAVGVVGYVAAVVTRDGDPTGEMHGWLAALARPTPLHYASVGTAASVVGHWTCRRWAMADEPPELADADAPVV